MPYARLRAERFIHAIRVAPRQLRTRPNPEHREVTQRGFADIGKRGKRLHRFHLRHGRLYNTDALSVRLLHPPYRRVPWKNGLGSTLEIATDAAEPGGSWTWRLSLADVPIRAPFSAFPGIDRHLAVLDGAGMTLEHEAERIKVPREGRAFSFAGEDTIIGTPVGSGVRDTNLMLDRTKWTGSLEIQRVHEHRSIEVEADVVLIFAAQTSDFLRCKTKEESCDLSADSTLLSTGLVRIEASHCTLVIARIDAHARPNVGNP
jgi:hypothetical protein